MDQAYATITTLLVLGAVGLTLLALYHLVLPFFLSRREQVRFELLDHDLRRVEELASRKAAILQMLREIEFDHQTEKISDRDFAELKRGYEREAVRVMRELDELRGGADWQAAVERQLAVRLEAQPLEAQPAHSAAADDTGDAQGVVCPACTKQMEPNARFCSQCGHSFTDATDDDDADASEHDADAAGDTPSHALAQALAMPDGGQVTP